MYRRLLPKIWYNYVICMDEQLTLYVATMFHALLNKLLMLFNVVACDVVIRLTKTLPLWLKHILNAACKHVGVIDMHTRLDRYARLRNWLIDMRLGELVLFLWVVTLYYFIQKEVLFLCSGLLCIAAHMVFPQQSQKLIITYAMTIGQGVWF